MNEATESSPQRRRARAMLWSVLAMVVLAMLLPSLGYVMAQTGGQGLPEPQRLQQQQQQQQRMQQQQRFGDERATNPRSDMWRGAREGQQGFTTQTGPYVTNTLISNVGENWRQFRTGPLVTYGGWFLVGVVALIALFFALVGTVRLEHGRSGMTIERWRAHERFLHWFTAISFIVLAITGLSLLFGRSVLIPMFGREGFAAYAQVARVTHNYLGPFFSIGVLLMIVLWVRHNIPNRVDLEWFKQGGGIIGKRHPSAGKLNGGEKLWFWLGVVVFGLTVSASGFVLDFPAYGQSRETMAWAQGVHAITALLWIGFFLGHAYIGTLGTEGAFEGMARGRVDVNWAKQHHDLWYQEQLAKGVRPVPAADTAKGGGETGAVGQPTP